MKPKLVRDRIPDIIRGGGNIPLTRIATPDEAKSLIIEKMYEELSEFAEAPSLEEAADIYHAFMAMIRVHGMTYDQVIKAAVEKAGERGRFNNMIVLENVV
tara:strand:+ start:3215 stop:3517 length:303 start_codon:yes stop_codon:yes gene_type:complete